MNKTFDPDENQAGEGHESIPEDTSHHEKSSIVRFAGVITGFLAFLLALGCAYEILHIKESLQQKGVQTSARLEGLKQQQLDTAAKLSSYEDNLSSLTHKIKSLKKQQATSNSPYQAHENLLKARYYLELAQINGHWSENQTLTLNLLQEADDVLQNAQGQNVMAVRQAIAKEMALLKANPPADITGFLSELDALQNLVDKIPVRQKLQNKAQDQDKTSAEKAGWKANMQQSLNMLKQLVIIRTPEENTEAELSPVYQKILRATVKMNFEEAQWAILQRNEKVFQYALQKALASIQKIFDTSAPSTQSLIEQIQSMQQKKWPWISIQINESLPLLNTLIQSDGEEAHD